MIYALKKIQEKTGQLAISTNTNLGGFFMSTITYVGNEPTASVRLSKYGQSRMYYLEEHNPDLYSEYLESGELYQHCLEVQQIAEN